jgi:hypothetical protein
MNEALSSSPSTFLFFTKKGKQRHYKGKGSWVWWCTPIIPVLGRLREEGYEFKLILGCIVNSWATL